MHDGYPEMGTKTLNTIRLMGLTTPATSVTVNGVSHTDFENLESGEVLVRNLNLVANSAFTVVFA